MCLKTFQRRRLCASRPPIPGATKRLFSWDLFNTEKIKLTLCPSMHCSARLFIAGAVTCVYFPFHGNRLSVALYTTSCLLQYLFLMVFELDTGAIPPVFTCMFFLHVTRIRSLAHTLHKFRRTSCENFSSQDMDGIAQFRVNARLKFTSVSNNINVPVLFKIHVSEIGMVQIGYRCLRLGRDTICNSNERVDVRTKGVTFLDLQ